MIKTIDVKKCSKCHKEKDMSQFYFRNGIPYYICKLCQGIVTKNNYNKNIERSKKYQAKYRKLNRNYIRKYNKERHAKNKEKISKYNRKYYLAVTVDKRKKAEVFLNE